LTTNRFRAARQMTNLVQSLFWRGSRWSIVTGQAQGQAGWAKGEWAGGRAGWEFWIRLKWFFNWMDYFFLLLHFFIIYVSYPLFCSIILFGGFSTCFGNERVCSISLNLWCHQFLGGFSGLAFIFRVFLKGTFWTKYLERSNSSDQYVGA